MSAGTLVITSDATLDRRESCPSDTPRLTVTTVYAVAAGPAGIALRPIARGLA